MLGEAQHARIAVVVGRPPAWKAELDHPGARVAAAPGFLDAVPLVRGLEGSGPVGRQPAPAMNLVRCLQRLPEPLAIRHAVASRPAEEVADLAQLALELRGGHGTQA